MSVDLDNPPVNTAPVIKWDDEYRFQQTWQLWLESIKDFLDNYVSSAGIKPPQMTLQERNALTDVENGQHMYITDDAGTPVNEMHVRIDGAWHKFDTTPV